MLKFLVSLSAPSASTVTATYSTADVTAQGVLKASTSGGDYVSVANKALTFKPGQVAKDVPITILSDTAAEGNETFTVNLSNVNGANVEDGSGIGTILDDDPGSGFRIAVGDTSFREGDATNRSVPVTIGFSDPAPSPFSLSVSTVAGTATIGSTPTSPAADLVSRSISIPVLRGRRFVTFNVVTVPDTNGEEDETFMVDVSTTLGTVTRPTGTVTIRDDGDQGRFAWAHSDGVGGNAVKVDAAGNAYTVGGGAGATLAKYDSAGTLLWSRTLSATNFLTPTALALDPNDGEVFTGFGAGDIAGSPEPNAGNSDAFVARYDTSGNLSWVHDLGSAGSDESRSVSVDGSGQVLISGSTAGTLSGSSENNAGNVDAFVASYDSSGTPLWVHQLGSSGADDAFTSTVDAAGNLDVAGQTTGTLPGSDEPNASVYPAHYDAFVAQYDPTGTRLWVHQLGSTGEDSATSVVVDPGSDLIVSGWTTGTLPGAPEQNTSGDDAFLAKYDASGTLLWVHQLGHSVPAGSSVAVDVDAGGDIAIAGTTDGPLSGAEAPPHVPSTAGHNDAFTAEYDAAGNLKWVHRLASKYDSALAGELGAADDGAGSVTLDASGAAYVTGTTSGQLIGSSDLYPVTSGLFQARIQSFIAKYDASGARIWVHQFGSNGTYALLDGIALGTDGGPIAVGFGDGPISLDPGGAPGGWIAHYSA